MSVCIGDFDLIVSFPVYVCTLNVQH